MNRYLLLHKPSISVSKVLLLSSSAKKVNSRKPDWASGIILLACRNESSCSFISFSIISKLLGRILIGFRLDKFEGSLFLGGGVIKAIFHTVGYLPVINIELMLNKYFLIFRQHNFNPWIGILYESAAVSYSLQFHWFFLQ